MVENKQPISLSELAKKSADKIIRDPEKVRTWTGKIGGFETEFQYLPVTKKIFNKLTSKSGVADTIDIVLTTCLWDSDTNRLWTLEEINDKLSMELQLELGGIIVEESGFNISNKELGF